MFSKIIKLLETAETRIQAVREVIAADETQAKIAEIKAASGEVVSETLRVAKIAGAVAAEKAGVFGAVIKAGTAAAADEATRLKEEAILKAAEEIKARRNS